MASVSTSNPKKLHSRMIGISTIPPNKNNSIIVYRPDIDGLRAVAIIPVVIFHAFPADLRGGFVGVDIFFVISGYLISSIIFRNLQNRTFSILEFFYNRIRRIFPSLIIVLVACYIFGWLVLLNDEFMQLGKHTVASTGFLQNFILIGESGYFDTASESKPLLHLWSLAIEEQFYIVYPIIVFAAWKSGINISIVILLLGTISFAMNLTWVDINPTKAFYWPHTRFWELLVGSGLAYMQMFRQVRVCSRVEDRCIGDSLSTPELVSSLKRDAQSTASSIAGVILIVSAVLFTDKSSAFPGWWAVMPVAGAALIIMAGPQALVNRMILANRLMVFVGLISYPLYLWHWPILSFLRIIEGEIPPWNVRLAAVTLSILLAWLTYGLIECPLRLWKNYSTKTMCLVVVFAAIGFVGYTTFVNRGFETRHEEFSRIVSAANDWSYPGKLTYAKHNETIGFYSVSSKRDATTLFIGDSNIEQYLPRVEAIIEQDASSTNGAIFMTGSGCLPIPNQPYDAARRHCFSLTQDALTIANERQNINTVVIGAQWNGYLMTGYGLTKGYGVQSPEYVIALDGLGAYIKELRAMDRRVFVLLNIPTGKQLDPRSMVKRDLASFPNILSYQAGSVPIVELKREYGRIQADIETIARNNGAVVINPIDSLCTPDCFGVDTDGSPMYRDGYHLTPKYVRSRANFIDATIR